MGKLFYIMGKSSTGKDSIFLELLKKKDLNLKNIISYTTRPIREHEVNGREYYFCSQEEKERYLKENRVIEIRTYHTQHGDWDYFTLKDEQLDLNHHNAITIGTLESYEKVRDYLREQNILPIYIEVEDGVRLRRALEREENESSPKFEELCRRFLADQKDFSEEKLKQAGIRKRFSNHTIDTTVNEIYQYMKKEID